MKKFAIVSLFAVTCHCLTAQHKVILKHEQEDVILNSFVYQYTDRDISLSSIDAVLRADSTALLRNASQTEVNYGFDQPKAWCKFYIYNTSGQENWILKIQQSRVDTVLLYIVRDHKTVEKLSMTGHFQTITKRPVYALPFAYPIDIKKGENIVFYLYTQREYGRHAAILNFQQKDRFENYEHFFIVLLGFVSGMVLLATLVGFILFLFTKQKVYAYYGLYALSCFSCSYDGYRICT